MAEHDNGYKLLFSHAEMVADLLRGFIREDWVRELDFSTLEKVGSGYVSDDLRNRESDVVWRLRWSRSERWIYVYLLLEFQSTVDPFMAVRVMTYVGLLYQDLIRQRLTPSGKLPPVLPVVLYNGNAPWRAARDVSDLVEAVPGGLERYRPQLCYCLLDEGRIALSELESLKNVAAALFRLEKSRAPEDIQKVLSSLLEWLVEQDGLRRAFATWLLQVHLPARLPGVEIPRGVSDLQEVTSMLEERVREWTQEWKQEGRQEGLEEVRGVLLRALESRFGPIPEMARRRVEEIDSFRGLTELSLQVVSAPSLASLGLIDETV